MRYSDEQVAADHARVAAEPTRLKASPSNLPLIPWTFSIAFAFGLFLAHQIAWGYAAFVAALVCAIAASINWQERYAKAGYRSAQSRRNLYEDSLETWQQAWRIADPEIRLPSSLSLKIGESVVFCCQSHRFLEKKLGRKTDRYSSRSSTGIGARSMAFGSIGLGHGIRVGVGGGPTRHSSSSSSEGHAFSHDVTAVEAVDLGELIITNERFVFTGLRDTIEISMDKIVGFHFFSPNDLIVDHAKRPAMESYSVPGPHVLSLCMARRLGHASFEIPDPPEPLPLGTSPLVPLSSNMKTVKSYAGRA